VVTKRIVQSLHLLGIAGFVVLSASCAAEDEGQDAPTSEAKGTRGAEVPAPAETYTSAPAEAPLLSWGFEPASADCNGWPARGADTIRAAPPRSGAYSCKVCSNGTSAEISLAREVGAVPRGSYVLTAWVRKRVQNEAPPEAVARIEATVGGVPVSATTQTVPIRDEWDRLEATLDLPGEASNLRVTIGAPSAEKAHCLFVDDVTLVRR
jgi:hypothetical protein